MEVSNASVAVPATDTAGTVIVAMEAMGRLVAAAEAAVVHVRVMAHNSFSN